MSLFTEKHMAGRSQLNQPLLNVSYACPHCRYPIELADASARCPGCGLRITLNGGIYNFLGETTLSDWQKTFESLADGPLGNTSAAVEYRSPLQQRYVVQGLRRACGQLPQHARILDVGCGNGIFGQSFLGGRAAIGIDYSWGMCKLARSRGILAHQANALALPFADAQFDLVYSAEVLQYVEDLPALCRELSRVCRVGGRILISTLNRTSVARRMMHVVRRFRPHPVGAANRTIIMRSSEEILRTTRGLPLSLERTCWTHFPLPWVRCGKSAHNSLHFLATNAILCFVKELDQ